MTAQFTPSKAIVPVPDNIRNQLGIKSTRDQGERFLHILLSGMGGQGKTAFIGTAGRRFEIDGELNIPNSNLLIIEYDPLGEETLWDMKVAADVVRPTSERQLLAIIKWLHTSEADQYDVIALDAYNRMQDVENEIVLQKGIELTKSRKASHDEEILELRDYNRLYKRCKTINDLLTPLKKHLIVTAIAGYKENPLEAHKPKESRDQILSLNVEGKMAHILSTQFSFHGVMSKKGSGANTGVETNFGLYNSEAKTRFRFEPSQMDITFPMMLELAKIKESAYRRIEWKHDHMGFLPELK